MPMVLEGITVIELATDQQGPVAGALLADMGADVIKIEDKDLGDPGRNVRGETPGQEPFPISYYFENNNRNKRGVALDYGTEAGRDVIRNLVSRADIFLSNFPISTLADMGLDYPRLSAANDKLIYAVSTGMGPAGPDKDKPINDIAAQFLGGILSHGNSDGPIPFWGGMANQEDALLLAFGIVTALIARERHGVGQEVYSALLGSQINWAALNVQSNIFNKKEPWGMRREAPLSPFWNYYQAKDGGWLCLGFLQESRDWHTLCQVLEREDLEFDPRFDSNPKRTKENNHVLIPIMREAFAQKPLAEWEEILGKHDLGWSKLNDYESLTDDPQVVANDYVVDFEHPKVGPVQLVGIPVRLQETPGSVRTPAPELGQHTEEVLSGVGGYGPDDLQKLREQGAI